MSLAEFSADFAVHGRLVAEPGNDFRYSGSSFQLAGRVAEVASGLDFRALFRARLARPCGMQRVGTDNDVEKAAQLARGYSQSFANQSRPLDSLEDQEKTAQKDRNSKR